MTYEIHVKTLSPQPIVSRRGRTSIADLGKTIGMLLGSVGQHLKSHGGQQVGPPFTRYHATSDLQAIEVEGGIPVAAPVPGEGEIEAGELPGGEVASTVHVGSYEGLPQAGAALEAWAAEQGRTAAGPRWESYVMDPGTEPDPQKWQTEVLMPLVTRG